MHSAPTAASKPTPKMPTADALAKLRNVGKAAMADFKLFGIETVAQLATQDADVLYLQLCQITRQRHDPCLHDVFAATIHQARTGEPLNWWAYSADRKARQAAGKFPTVQLLPINIPHANTKAPPNIT